MDECDGQIFMALPTRQRIMHFFRVRTTTHPPPGWNAFGLVWLINLTASGSHRKLGRNRIYASFTGARNMIGAIAGDIIGSAHEAAGTKTKHFELFDEYARFTDDTVLTVAVADSILSGTDLVGALHKYFDRYPQAGYGGTFIRWSLKRQREPYNSWGNGSAMRVSPVAYAYDTLEEVLHHAERTAAVTHNHPEGIKGAQATAAAVYLARRGAGKPKIKQYVETQFGYDLSTPLREIRPVYLFDVSCQGSVPQSLRAFLEADDFEDAARNAISLGGDADTMASITCAVAEAHFGIPIAIEEQALSYLNQELLAVVEAFRERYMPRPANDSL
jgi:ADP-ribosylglycohydrolase